MSPILVHGNEVLVDSCACVQVGDVVLARHPFRTDVLVVKRVASIDARGWFELLGDDPSESSDSRTLGLFEASTVIGKVTCRL